MPRICEIHHNLFLHTKLKLCYRSFLSSKITCYCFAKNSLDLLFTVVSSFELAATNAASVEAPSKVQCGQCPLFRDRITSLEEDIEEISLQENEIRVKLETSRSALAASIERETKLKYVRTMNRTVLMMCTAKVIKLSVLMRHFLICCSNVLHIWP